MNNILKGALEGAAHKETPISKAEREPLSRKRVMEAALRIADSEGLEALSMRRLGRELGVEAMSLYRYVKDKDSLLSGLLDHATVEFVPPSDEGDWREWLHSWMTNTRAVFVAHPEIFKILLGGGSFGPRVMSTIESAFQRMATANLDDESQQRVWRTLTAFLYGYLIQGPIQPGEISPADFAAKYPNLARSKDFMDCCDSDRDFSDSVRIILAGIDDNGRLISR